jgi:hypothetical protein
MVCLSLQALTSRNLMSTARIELGSAKQKKQFWALNELVILVC